MRFEDFVVAEAQEGLARVGVRRSLAKMHAPFETEGDLVVFILRLVVIAPEAKGHGGGGTSDPRRAVSRGDGTERVRAVALKVELRSDRLNGNRPWQDTNSHLGLTKFWPLAGIGRETRKSGMRVRCQWARIVIHVYAAAAGIERWEKG